jgi:Ni/Co efflux regulator RcnB
MTFFRKHLLWTLALAMVASTAGVVQARADDHDRDHKQQDRNWKRNQDRNSNWNRNRDRDGDHAWNRRDDRRDYRYQNNGSYNNGYYNNGRSYPYSRTYGNNGYYGNNGGYYGNNGYGNNGYYGGYAQNNDTQRAYQAGYNNGVNDRMRNKSLNLRTGNWRGINLQAYDRGYQDGYRGGGGRGRGW